MYNVSCLAADLFEGPVHLRLLARNPPHEVRVEPGVQELRPVADTPLVWSQGYLVSRVELARPNLPNFRGFGRVYALQ